MDYMGYLHIYQYITDHSHHYVLASDECTSPEILEDIFKYHYEKQNNLLALFRSIYQNSSTPNYIREYIYYNLS